MSLEYATGSDFEEKIKGGQLVLVDFYADWCGPCRTIAPVLEELSREYNNQLKVVKVDVDSDGNRDLVMKFGVSSIPHLEILKEGKSIAKKVGAGSKTMMKAWIDSVLK